MQLDFAPQESTERHHAIFPRRLIRPGFRLALPAQRKPTAMAISDRESTNFRHATGPGGAAMRITVKAAR
jgi:hypothetical protein